MMAKGSSLRGLSDVMIITSDADWATSPISPRFERSRSPPQPNTTMTRPVGYLVGRTEHGCQGIGGVSIVHGHGEGLTPVDDLEPAPDRCRGRQSVDDRGLIMAQHEGGGGGSQGVGHIVVAGQLEHDRTSAPATRSGSGHRR